MKLSLAIISAATRNGVSASAAPCNPDAASWLDTDQKTCKDYVSYYYCTTDGGYGGNWTYNRPGTTFADFESDGFTALNCVECGCVNAGAPTCAPDSWKDTNKQSCADYEKYDYCDFIEDGLWNHHWAWTAVDGYMGKDC